MKHLSKFVALVCLLTLTVVFVAGCGGSKEPADNAGANSQPKKINIKVGHVLDSSHAYHLGALKFAELVKEKTNGQVEVNVFPNSQLGAERQMLEAMQAGTLEMAISSSGPLVGFVPEWSVFDLPYLFTSYDEAFKVLDGPVGQKFIDLTIKKGIRPLYYWNCGFRNVYSNKTLVKSVKDFAGMKIRVMENPTYIAAFKAMGASPVPMAYSEVYSALEQKVVDAAENSFMAFYSSKHYEVAKYMSGTKHTFLPVMLHISEKFYQTLPEDVKKAIVDSAKEAGLYERELFVKQDEEAIKNLRNNGVTVELISDFAPFKEAVQPVWDNAKSIPGGEENLKAIQDALK